MSYATSSRLCLCLLRRSSRNSPCTSSSTNLIRFLSTGKVRWKKPLPFQKIENDGPPVISPTSTSIPSTTSATPTVKNKNKKSFKLEIHKERESNNDKALTSTTTTTTTLESSESTPPSSLPNLREISSGPIKLLNSVDPKVLLEATAAAHRLDYAKLPSYYLGLSKSRLTGLVVVTAMAGYAMAPASFALLPFASLTLGTALTSASANTINQIMEVDFDSQMDRTKNRVLVQRNLSMEHAKMFAAVTGAGGVALLLVGANELTAALGAFNLALYTCAYTPLKRRTIYNTWVGSIVGGIPPVMGWAAATGELSHGALLLGGILYAWQFPHFNALSWNIRKDYDKAGYKMMAISHPDLCKTTSLRYSFGIVAMSSLAPVCNVTSWAFVVDSLPLNGYLCYLAYKFYKEGDSASSRKLFRFTLIHLPLLIMLMMITKKNYDKPCNKDEVVPGIPAIMEGPAALLNQVTKV